MRTTLALAVILSLATTAFAGKKHPLKKDVIPAGPGWSCTDDKASSASMCFRTEEACSTKRGHDEQMTECHAINTAASCYTYKEKTAEASAFSCSVTAKACAAARAILMKNKDYGDVSDCASVK